jgi:hypothetical protein
MRHHIHAITAQQWLRVQTHCFSTIYERTSHKLQLYIAYALMQYKNNHTLQTSALQIQSPEVSHKHHTQPVLYQHSYSHTYLTRRGSWNTTFRSGRCTNVIVVETTGQNATYHSQYH